MIFVEVGLHSQAYYLFHTINPYTALCMQVVKLSPKGHMMCARGVELSLSAHRVHAVAHPMILLLRSSFEREYLHKTRIPTYHFQKSLPRLPVPELEKSCQRYLNAQLPLMSEAEHKELQKVVAEFQTGRGPGEQQDLDRLR